MKRFFILIILFLFNVSFLSQKASDPYVMFDSGNFIDALPEFEIMFADNPKNDKIIHHLAVCYLNTNGDKSRAIPLLEELTNNRSTDPINWYLLGRAYHFGYQFVKANECFYSYLSEKTGDKVLTQSTKEFIEYCIHGNELMKYPIDVTFENLGKNINSEFDDYFPFIPSNESYVMYNSKRNYRSEINANGEYLSNVYYSNVNLGKFQKAKLITENVNSIDASEEIVGMNEDGSKIVIYKDDQFSDGDLIMGTYVDKSVVDYNKMGKTINSKFSEIAGCLHGNQFYFASNRPGGYGGIDIYRCQELPNGKWSEAYNLGPEINTSSDEDFPSLSVDGKILFFSSKGHYSMGGYDIFKAIWDPVRLKFVNVKNLGYPINTPEDNMNIRISSNGQYGYVSAIREEGFGGLDIYRVKFNSLEPRYSVVMGKITTTETTDEMINISITDLSNYEIYGEYTPNEISYRYIMILPPGSYLLSVDCVGFQSISEKIEILDKSSFRSEIIKDLQLKLQ